MKNNNKTGFSVLFGILTYLFSQLIILLSLFVISLFNDNILELFKDNIQVNPGTFKLLSILSIILYLILILLISFLSKKLLNKGVNIE